MKKFNGLSKEEIIKFSEGNPGALNALMQSSEESLSKLKESNIRGWQIWVLFSDLCGKQSSQVDKLLKNCPIEIVEDACSRQDYSGRELVKEYL